MKKLIILFGLLIMISYVMAQAPYAFNYQTILRDSDGWIIPNQIISLRISVLQGSASGTLKYKEVHNGISTDQFGVVNIAIGNGTVQSGSLESINWAEDSYFLKIEMDPNGGTTYQVMGTTQLLSVPYTLHSKTTEFNDDSDADPENELNTNLTFNGTNLYLSDPGGTLSVNLSSLQNDADADPNNEFQTLSLTGNNLSIIPSGNSVTIDGNPNNECNTSLSLNGTILQLIDGCGTKTTDLVSLADDEDADPSNECNNSLTLNGTVLQLIDGCGTKTTDLVSLADDEDADPDNECQSLSISGNTLTLTGASGTCSSSSVILPSGGLTLPYSGNYNGTSNAFELTHSGSSGNVMYLKSNNSSNTEEALTVETYSAGEIAKFRNYNSNNSSEAFTILTNGTGRACFIKADNTSNDSEGLYVWYNGLSWAGFFEGDVFVAGEISKLGGGFTIDHPIDPQSKILTHSFVESPERMNIYKGRAKLMNGEAIIELPGYFDALNHPHGREINLTCVNGWSPLYMEDRIEGNQFVVKTTDQGNPEQEFSWVIYAVRNDKFAQDHPIVVEKEKGVNNNFIKGELLYKK
jgi:hypothetical protein